MGQQTGSSKSTSPPNPNYGSGAGTDNSNGVYNASASAQAAQQPQYDAGLGAGAIGATGATAPLASPILTPPAGATGTADPNQVAGATGATTTTTATAANPNGAAYGTGAQVKGQSKGQQPPTMQGAATTLNGALAGGPTGQPPAYSTSYVPPPPATTAAPGASSPMSGSSLTIGDAIGQKGQAKGGVPGAPAGTGGMVGGMANATNPANAATAGQLPTNTGNAMQDYQNRQKNAQATLTATPWMQKMLTGVDAFGGTNESRAKYEQDNALGARSNAGENTYQHGGNDTNWQAWVQKQTGQSDAWAAMKQLADTARNTKGGIGQLANMRRSMEASGIAPGTAARVLEMFHDSGGGAESAARRLGVYDQYINAGMGMGDKSAAGKAASIQREKELAAWHKANPTGTAAPPPAAAAPPPAAGNPTPPQRTATTGAGGITEQVKQVAQSPQVASIAKQYGVTPEIAAQIYQQILAQSQSSGGGNSENSGSGGSE